MDRLAARRQAHAEALPTFQWVTPADLVTRWRVSRSTVYAIPFTELPYKEFGKPGSLRSRRRYLPADVATYEAATPKRAA